MATSLVIEPLDVLLFRDGKPFSAGMDHLARSVFPPFPATIAGLVRSRLLLEARLDWQAARERFGDFGSPDSYGGFRMEGLFLRKGDTDFVPVPGDVVNEKGRLGPGVLKVIRPLKRGGAPPVASNFPDDRLLYLWTPAGGPVDSATGFVSLEELFGRCLLGEPPTRTVEEEEFVRREPRTGIGVNPSRRTAEEGRLFTVGFLRLLDGTGFHVRFSGVMWPGRSGVDTLGGERRPVRWSVLDQWAAPAVAPVEAKVRSSGRFKIVLLTPAVFETGWGPGPRFEASVSDFGVEVELIGAVVGRPVRVGGFDLANRRPKPMRPAAPAGSVYFYEVRNGDPARLAGTWGMRCIADRDWEAGMGLSVLGGWDYA